MSYLLELIPGIQPRAFSIASAMTVGMCVEVGKSHLSAGLSWLCTDTGRCSRIPDPPTSAQKGQFDLKL